MVPCLPAGWLGRSCCLCWKPRGDRWHELPGRAASEPDRCLPGRKAPQEEGQQSAFSLSKELSILVKVFLIRRAVSLADGFWYQHSFINLARDVNVWKRIRTTHTHKYTNHNPELQQIGLLGPNTAWLYYLTQHLLSISNIWALSWKIRVW